MIKGRNSGDNITIMNTMFRRGVDPEDNKYKDYLTLIYKDCDTGLKYMQEMIDPDYEYYMINQDKRVNYPRLFAHKEDTEKIVVPYKDLDKDIAKRVGLTDFYYENIKNGNRGENRKIHTHPDVFNSDSNIEDHYRFRFDRFYKNEPFNPTKSYLDIEADTISMVGDFPEPGECPINAITIVLQEQKLIYTFLLRNKSNPQIDEFEKTVIDGSVFPELEQFVIEAVGGPAVAKRYNIDYKYNFLFYNAEDEINLIKDAFNAINSYKPDFVLAWNMGFDIPYIIARTNKLGYRSEDILCHPDFKHKIARYYVDEKMKSEFAERGDYAQISSYSVFLDQMIQFASRRKGQGKFSSFTLDFIGQTIAKVKKLDYKHITTNIAELPYKDYKTFVFYNIMDTIVQQCIEQCTNDIEYVFGKCIMNNTRYSKAHRQTVYLTNRGIKEFYNTDDGYIMGNNTNKFNSKPNVKFPGAFVADPRQVNNYSRLRIYGSVVDVFDNLDDFDYASLYPSIIRQFNIAPNTQIGMILINQKVFENENKHKLDNWTRQSAFAEDVQSQVWLVINSRWFNLADYTTLYNEVIEFFRTKANSMNGLRYYDRSGLIIPMIDYNPNYLQTAMIYNTNEWNSLQDAYIPQNLDRWEAFRNDRLQSIRV